MASFNTLPEKLQIKIFGFVSPTSDLVAAMRVSKKFKHIIYGRLLFANTTFSTNVSFHKFICCAPKRVHVSTFMLTIEIHLTTAWDTRVLVAPDWVVEERARLDPATNTSATWDHYASVEKEWRRKEAAKMEKDLKFFSTLVTRKESLINLRQFTCTIDKQPPFGLTPAPASMPVDTEHVIAIGRRLQDMRGLMVKEFSDNGDRCFMACEKF